MLYLREKGQARCDRPADHPSFDSKRGVSSVPGPSSRPTHPEPDVRAHLVRSPSILVIVMFLATACASSATPRPTTPPDATGSLLPPATATVPPSASVAPAFPVTLADDEGTKVTLKTEPQKIVSLTPAETEILFALGVGDRIVGKVEDVTPYPPEVSSIPDV